MRADEKRLRQILINLLGNAVKFTRSGPRRVPRCAMRARWRCSRSRTPARASPPDELERIFEPFARGSAAGQGGSGGTGLGLTIAKMLTDLMGGEMTVESQPGRGTLLPRPPVPARAARRRAAGAAGRAQRTGYAGERRRILVVDNEEVDRGLLVSVLEPLGFEVRRRPRARSAWRCCASSGAGGPTRSSWTWRCPASTAGRRCAASAARRSGRRAGGHRLGQRLRQGAGQRRRHHAARLHHQAGARERTARLAGPRAGARVDHGRPAARGRRCPRRAEEAARAARRAAPAGAAGAGRTSATCAASSSGSTRSRPSRRPARPSSSACARWRAASSSTR